jgi:hypothetical protein
MPLEALVCSRVISQISNGKRQRKTELDMGGVYEETFERLEYHQGVSIR